MAPRGSHPGRTLVVFFLGLALAYGLVALAGTWTPKLGLDLQGGTRITLVAEGDVTSTTLEEARKIIESRVNGSGVAESEVTTQGERFVVVEIPGESRRDLVETVKRQAQLRFRLVATSASGAAGATGTSPVPGATESESPAPTQPEETKKKKDRTENRRAPLAWAAEGEDEQDPLAWIDSPDQESLAAFEAFSCPAGGAAADVVDDPDQPLVTCDQYGRKYLLSAAMIEGTDLSSADTRAPDQTNVEWGVSLDFDAAGTKQFTRISEALVGTQKQFAIVLDGQVISAPTMNSLITNGQADITGQFDEATADSLATSLKYGALPVSFEKDPPVELVGPSLAGNQLSAGLTAGLVGLVLVMLYCLAYYRGLGTVVIASLLVAAALTYALVVLLSQAAGLTLTLPGIAGLIVAVGITADSFVVYFERIRDEMRDGKSMRVAVEAGWARARNTCLAADTVSLLAALVLYVFATGVVKGFAFALGLATLIDLVVFFWFTHPMVSWLARFPFFHRGHAMSGLGPDSLGLSRGGAA